MAASPEVRDAIARLGEDDAQLVAKVAPGADFGRAVAQATIDLSSREGGEVYRLAYRLTAPTLRDGMGHEYDGAKGDDPDQYLRPDPDALRAFYDLEGRGLRRAATALRWWEARFEPARAAAPEALVARSLALLLPYHDAAAARRASYHPQAEEHPGIAWGYPAVALALLCAIGAAVVARRRRRVTP